MALDLLVMTGSRPRHRFFAVSLLEAFPNAAALVEGDPGDAAVSAPDSAPLVAEHFRTFAATERRIFAAARERDAFLRERTIRSIPRGTINDPETVRFIEHLDPSVVAVHATSLIASPLIDALPFRLINLHAGLSPYYRGSGANVWPFYDRALEYVGMTIHYIDAGIDRGDILLQGRPTFEPDDDTHTIGCKNVHLGATLMRRVIERHLANGPLPGVVQDTTRGRLYRKAEFDEAAVRAINEFIALGGVGDYARSPRDVDIVTW